MNVTSDSLGRHAVCEFLEKCCYFPHDTENRFLIASPEVEGKTG